MLHTIDLGNITADVELKDIKNIHLSVHPPLGRIRIAAPERMDLETIRMFAISKLSWIKKQQARQLSQEREAPREYQTRESHYFLGKRYLLKVVEAEAKPLVSIRYNTLYLQVRPGTTTDERHLIIQEWYRVQLKEIVPKYISKWESILGLKVEEFGIKKMKTKWGTCNREQKRIWINLELAKKPLDCLEYIIVHEMIHFMVRNHNTLFISHIDSLLPNWRHTKQELNRLPVSHTEWKY